ncbi:hypothetical protein GPECTOR_251g626 [Gonium pectorale]|uniref:Uncharacterized protein n=1 Tax=Gonium pectorale TaxID=33097 RepID=A0A150FWD7_GONPE|nr:hypothetical protein GPECTOR_251g626 [Gonium pectorale]|eukprot:KXZ41888.1 hypothetical protein GPECTOR_251g626 [Gonium pectorale]
MPLWPSLPNAAVQEIKIARIVHDNPNLLAKFVWEKAGEFFTNVPNAMFLTPEALPHTAAFDYSQECVAIKAVVGKLQAGGGGGGKRITADQFIEKAWQVRRGRLRYAGGR